MPQAAGPRAIGADRLPVVTKGLLWALHSGGDLGVRACPPAVGCRSPLTCHLCVGLAPSPLTLSAPTPDSGLQWLLGPGGCRGGKEQPWVRQVGPGKGDSTKSCKELCTQSSLRDQRVVTHFWQQGAYYL